MNETLFKLLINDIQSAAATEHLNPWIKINTSGLQSREKIESAPYDLIITSKIMMSFQTLWLQNQENGSNVSCCWQTPAGGTFICSLVSHSSSWVMAVVGLPLHYPQALGS